MIFHATQAAQLRTLAVILQHEWLQDRNLSIEWSDDGQRVEVYGYNKPGEVPIIQGRYDILEDGTFEQTDVRGRKRLVRPNA